MKTGLYIGRFQPFHFGHLSAVRQALKQADRLYITIGSSQYSHEAFNPFSARERMKMIRLTLEEAGLLNRCEIFQVPDIHEDGKWVAHVRQKIPPFDMVFIGNNGLVKKLFNKEGKTPVIEVRHELEISATQVRESMRSGQNWKNYVGRAAAEYIEKIDGIKRIRQN